MALKDELSIDKPVVVIRGVQTRRKYPGKVVKIARKYVTIEYDRGLHTPGYAEFSIETQKERGSVDHYAAVFRTLEQQDRLDREDAVRDALKLYGLMPRYAGPTPKRTLTLEQMESVVELLDRIAGRDDEDPELSDREAGS